MFGIDMQCKIPILHTVPSCQSRAIIFMNCWLISLAAKVSGAWFMNGWLSERTVIMWTISCPDEERNPPVDLAYLRPTLGWWLRQRYWEPSWARTEPEKCNELCFHLYRFAGIWTFPLVFGYYFLVKGRCGCVLCTESRGVGSCWWPLHHVRWV